MRGALHPAIAQVLCESDNLREFITELRPAALDALGLAPALETLVQRMRSVEGLEVDATIDVTGTPDARLPPELETAVYRVAQEALTNVARHAQASRVEVSIQKLPAAVRMEIKDDGKSFQVQRVLHPRRNNRLGLLGMRERVEMVGGSFSVESAPGKGTTVLAEIPLANGGVRGEGGKPVDGIRQNQTLNGYETNQCPAGRRPYGRARGVLQVDGTRRRF